MEISKGIEVVDLGLFIVKEKVLVVSDLHIGYEEELNKKGVLMPRFSFKDLVDRLDLMLKEVRPKVIVINGDLKHEFGTISEQEWRDTLKVIDMVSRFGKIVLVKGNHDNILGPIAKKRKVEVVDKFEVDGVCVAHGDSVVETKKKVVIIGHEHPAVMLSEGERKEKVKCFLKGKFKGKELIVMPSMNQVTEGTDVLSEKLLSPYLQKSLGSFEVYVVADKVYDFGKLKNLS